jgi:hypothetical protein
VAATPRRKVCTRRLRRAEKGPHPLVYEKEAGDVGVAFTFLRRRRRSYHARQRPRQLNRSGLVLIRSVACVPSIVPKLDRRIGQVVFVAERTKACCI